MVGLGSFQRGLSCVAFSVEVSSVAVPAGILSNCTPATCRCFMFDTFQDGGAHVVGVDDGNDHILSVWEWESKKKVAEAKVRLSRFFKNYHLSKVDKNWVE